MAQRRNKSWLDKAKRVFTRRKMPAWLALLLLALQGIPDWKSRLDFWLGAAQQQGGFTAMMASVVASPYFSPALAAAAGLYLVFVGEPKRGVQRHPWWPAVAWSVFAVCTTAIAWVLGSGYFEVRVREAVAQRHFEPWSLTPDQKARFGELLAKQPEKFPVRINSLIGNSQSQIFAFSIFVVLNERQWPAAYQMDPGLNPALKGVQLSFPIDIPVDPLPPNARKMQTMLEDVGITFEPPGNGLRKSTEQGIGPDAFWIVIGNQP